MVSTTRYILLSGLFEQSLKEQYLIEFINL